MSDFALTMQPELRQWVHPSLIEANQILGLSTLALERAIAAEVDANPALEVEEHPACPRCGRRLDGGGCQACGLPLGTPAWPPQIWDDEAESQAWGATGRDGAEVDPLALVAADEPLRDRLLADLAPGLTPPERSVAEYLLGTLDERGFLTESIGRVAAATGRPMAVVERVLRAIQAAGPAGIAARDARECLLLQLAALESPGDAPPAVGRIVGEHLEDLAAHRYGAIARRLGVDVAAVEAARDFIRRRLTPCPLQDQAAPRSPCPTTTIYTPPDVVITRRGDGFQIEMMQPRAASPRLHPHYTRLAADLARGCTGVTEAERRHVRQALARARLFIAKVNQRQATIEAIATCLVEVQEDFLREGVRALRPLTRAMVAARLGVHESTVSRATADKYVMLPSRQVVPFSTFFTASLSVKDAIRDLVRDEPAALTDRDLADRLLAQGYRVARRTIAKYRAELGILPSTHR